MSPDLVLLRDLVETSSVISTMPDSGKPEAAIRATESVVGPLPPSYRWWLTEYGEGTVNGAEVATIAPLWHADAVDVTTGQLDGDRLCFYQETDGGDRYCFALDQRAGSEHAVVRRDHFTGDEQQVADSFAGFLTVQAALASGLKDGPNPSIARLWRSTPGALLPNGVVIYGPHIIRERNNTYEVREYAPDWVLIGDDSGGRGLFMRRHGRDRASVYRLDLGIIEQDIEGIGELLTDDLINLLGT